MMRLAMLVLVVVMGVLGGCQSHHPPYMEGRPFSLTTNEVPGQPTATIMDISLDPWRGFGQSTYQVYVQPDVGAQGWIVDPQFPPFLLQSGWCYAVGVCPIGNTPTVGAASDGTKFVLRLIGSTTHVYLLDIPLNHALNLTTARTGQSPFQMRTAPSHVFVESDGDISDMGGISGDHLRWLKTVVEPAVIAAGLPY